jgi:hypothetical protein
MLWRGWGVLELLMHARSINTSTATLEVTAVTSIAAPANAWCLRVNTIVVHAHARTHARSRDIERALRLYTMVRLLRRARSAKMSLFLATVSFAARRSSSSDDSMSDTLHMGHVTLFSSHGSTHCG